MHTRSLIHLQLNAVRVKPPINRMAEALKSTFGRFYGSIDASGATDHDTLLPRARHVQNAARSDRLGEK